MKALLYFDEKLIFCLSFYRKKIIVRIIETANSPNSSSVESDDDEQENNLPPPSSGSPQLCIASEYISKFATIIFNDILLLNVEIENVFSLTFEMDHILQFVREITENPS